MKKLTAGQVVLNILGEASTRYTTYSLVASCSWKNKIMRNQLIFIFFFWPKWIKMKNLRNKRSSVVVLMWKQTRNGERKPDRIRYRILRRRLWRHHRGPIPFFYPNERNKRFWFYFRGFLKNLNDTRVLKKFETGNFSPVSDKLG